MGVLHLGGMTLGSVFKKPETTCYPFETKPAPEGLKGHVVNDPETCILCGICAKRCPAGAIAVDRAKRTWTCDGFQCIQCFVCVLECPKDSLSMDTAYTAPATAKEKVQCVIPK